MVENAPSVLKEVMTDVLVILTSASLSPRSVLVSIIVSAMLMDLLNVIIAMSLAFVRGQGHAGEAGLAIPAAGEMGLLTDERRCRHPVTMPGFASPID